MAPCRLLVASVGFIILSFIVLVSSSQGERAISDTVDSVLKSVQDMVNSLQDFVGDKNGCAFRCPAGSRPVPNRHHQPSSNGCGAFGLQFDSEISVKSVTKCCDDHDVCYDTCNKGKVECDKVFKSCLDLLCDKAKHLMSKDLHKGCMATVDIMYAGAVALGCKPYKDAQDKACVCERQKYDYEL